MIFANLLQFRMKNEWNLRNCNRYFESVKISSIISKVDSKGGSGLRNPSAKLALLSICLWRSAQISFDSFGKQPRILIAKKNKKQNGQNLKQDYLKRRFGAR